MLIFHEILHTVQSKYFSKQITISIDKESVRRGGINKGNRGKSSIRYPTTKRPLTTEPNRKTRHKEGGRA